jgi:hypothetical protein
LVVFQRNHYLSSGIEGLAGRKKLFGHFFGFKVKDSNKGYEQAGDISPSVIQMASNEEDAQICL